MIKTVALILLILGIGVGVFLVTTGRFQLFPKAQITEFEEFTPNVIVTNVTDKSLTISYFTPYKPVRTQISYGKNGNLDKTKRDDQNDPGLSRYAHHATLEGLEANTEYDIKIEIGNESYPKDNFVKVKTGPSVSENPSGGMMFRGKAVNKQDTGATDGIVYLKAKDGQYLSTYLSKGGRWQIPLLDYRTADLSGAEVLDPFDPVDILVVSGLDGYGYYGTLVMDREDELKIILDSPRNPFFKVQFPGNNNSQDTTQVVLQDDSKGQSNSASSPGFFEVIWTYIKSFFGFK